MFVPLAAERRDLRAAVLTVFLSDHSPQLALGIGWRCWRRADQAFFTAATNAAQASAQALHAGCLSS